MSDSRPQVELPAAEAPSRNPYSWSAVVDVLVEDVVKHPVPPGRNPLGASRDADEVKSLPGWDGALPSKHYSGYLDVRWLGVDDAHTHPPPPPPPWCLVWPYGVLIGVCLAGPVHLRSLW